MARLSTLTLVTFLLYVIQVHGRSYRVVETTVGRTALLPCSVDFSGTPQVMWLDPDNSRLTMNEEIITEDERFSVDRPYNDEWNLEIEEVRTSDQGNYTCLINAVPVQRKYVYLQIVSAPTIVSSSPDTAMEAGSDVTLQCEAEGIPHPLISWHRFTYKGERQDLPGDNNTLILTNISRADAGTYRCEANNGVPPPASAAIRVDVLFAPTLQLPHQYLSQEQGRDTFLQCTITANPHEQNHWERDGVVLQDSAKYTITVQDTDRYNRSLFLYVKDLRSEDFGAYDCVSANDYGRAKGTVHLFEWQSGTARVTSQPEDVISGLHTDVRMNCTVENMGSSDSLIWWRHHPTLGYFKIFESHPSSRRDRDNAPDILQFDAQKYEIKGHYNLLVKNVTLEDSGEYFCELSGKKNHTATVTIVDQLFCDNNYENKTHIEEGDVASLSCSMAFSGPPRLWHALWQHNDRKLSSIDEDQAMVMRRTIAFPAFAMDSGMYTCVISSAQPAFSMQCGLEVYIVGQEPTPKPLCKSDPWDIATTSLAIIIASCVGGTALVFLVITLCICSHYRKRLRCQKTSPAIPNIYGMNGGGQHQSGSISLEEIRRLTAQNSEQEHEV